MPNNLITPDKYVRITDKTYFVGDEETRYYHDELVLQRDFVHTEEIANLRKKHPNLTAVHCMISETDCEWFDSKYGKDFSDTILRYNLGNLSVVPGIYQWVRAELCNKYFTPWYYSGLCVDKSIFKLCYTINSLGDSCILTAISDKEFNNMLNFFDCDPKFIGRDMSRWINGVRSRWYSLSYFTQKQR